MSNTFTFYTDPGHGWLQVTLEDLRAVNLWPEDFSRYSYREGADIFYLEEDCDAMIFMNAYNAKYGELPVIHNRHHDSESPVRRLPRLA